MEYAYVYHISFNSFSCTMVSLVFVVLFSQAKRNLN